MVDTIRFELPVTCRDSGRFSFDLALYIFLSLIMAVWGFAGCFSAYTGMEGGKKGYVVGKIEGIDIVEWG